MSVAIIGRRFGLERQLDVDFGRRGVADVFGDLHGRCVVETRAHDEIGVEREVFFGRRVVLEVIVFVDNGLDFFGRRIVARRCGCAATGAIGVEPKRSRMRRPNRSRATMTARPPPMSQVSSDVDSLPSRC